MEDIRFCGQVLEAQQRSLIIALAKRYGRLSRHELAQTVCELLDWHRPNGQPKMIECRALLERLQEAGLIGLPALQSGRPCGVGSSVPVSPDPESAPLDAPLATLRPVRLRRVTAPGDRTLWRTLIERHHPPRLSRALRRPSPLPDPTSPPPWGKPPAGPASTRSCPTPGRGSGKSRRSTATPFPSGVPSH